MWRLRRFLRHELEESTGYISDGGSFGNNVAAVLFTLPIVLLNVAHGLMAMFALAAFPFVLLYWLISAI